MDLHVWEWEGGLVPEVTEPGLDELIPADHWMAGVMERASPDWKHYFHTQQWTLDELRNRAKMEADKVSGVEPPPLIKDKDGNMRDKDGNKVRTAQEERELQRGKACGGLCGRTFLCNCNSTKWLVPRQMWVCEGCWNDYQRLWGKS